MYYYENNTYLTNLISINHQKVLINKRKLCNLNYYFIVLKIN